MSTLDQEIETLDNRFIVEEITGSKAVSASTETTLASLTLSPGEWLIISHIGLSANVSVTYNHVLDGLTVRSTGVNGGGSINVRYRKTTTSPTLYLKGYCSQALTMNYRILKIKLKDV